MNKISIHIASPDTIDGLDCAKLRAGLERWIRIFLEPCGVAAVKGSLEIEVHPITETENFIA